MAIAIIVGFVIFCLIIASIQGSSDRADIDRWALSQGFQIEEIEKTWFDNGPYWMRGKRRIYRCRVRDNQGRPRTVYMRTRFMHNDYEFYDP